MPDAGENPIREETERKKEKKRDKTRITE